MRLVRDLDALRQHLLLVRRLDLAQVRQQLGRILDPDAEEPLPDPVCELVDSRQRSGEAGPRAEQERQPGTAPLQRGEKGVVFLRGVAALAERHAAQHRADEALELRRRIDRVDAALGGRLLAGQRVAHPVFAAGVGIADEEHVLPRLVPGHQDQDGLFLIDAGQVVEVVVLPELVVHVEREDLGLGAPQNEHRLGSERLPDARAPGLQIVLQLAGQRRDRRSEDRDSQQGTKQSSHGELPQATGYRLRAMTRLRPWSPVAGRSLVVGRWSLALARDPRSRSLASGLIVA